MNIPRVDGKSRNTRSDRRDSLKKPFSDDKHFTFTVQFIDKKQQNQWLK